MQTAATRSLLSRGIVLSVTRWLGKHEQFYSVHLHAPQVNGSCEKKCP